MTEAEYEELQYAAIAAGYKPVRLTDDSKYFLLEGVQKPWNPLTDNEDAFCLAVKLNITVVCGAPSVVLCAYSRGEDAHPDPYVATRRAIVRAAAEIGKQLGAAA